MHLEYNFIFSFYCKHRGGADKIMGSFKFQSNLNFRDIDSAFLRRFERKILIDVPTIQERQSIIKQFLPCARRWRADDMEELALLAENFTGDDIRVAIKEAKMILIRKKIRSENFVANNEDIDDDVETHHLKEAFKQVKLNSESDINKHRLWNSSFVKN